jgi:hypothetical protein
MKMNRIAALVFCLLTPSCGPDWSDCGEAGCGSSTESPEAPAPGPDIVIVIEVDQNQNQGQTQDQDQNQGQTQEQQEPEPQDPGPTTPGSPDAGSPEPTVDGGSCSHGHGDCRHGCRRGHHHHGRACNKDRPHCCGHGHRSRCHFHKLGDGVLTEEEWKSLPSDKDRAAYETVNSYAQTTEGGKCC